MSVALAATGVAVVPLSAPAAAASGEQARSALDFLDSLGVNVHMGYNKTRYSDVNATITALRQLGITHVRENIHITSQKAMPRIKTMLDKGIRFDFIVPRPDESGGSDPSPTIDYIAQNFAAGTDAIEGPNEFDSSKSSDWASQLRAVQRKVAPDMASHGSLRDKLIYGPSLINWKLKKDAPTVGDLSNALTYGNVHSYPGGQMPETQIESQSSLYRQYISAGKPVVATETGYHNAIQDASNSHPSATERTSGIYYPRLYLEYFRFGVERTYGYELFDQGTTSDQEDHFGLFRTDGSAKPAAKAIGAMTTILADGAQAPGGSLAYSMTDPSAGKNGSDIRHVLLQKSDGTFYLALWRAESIATPGTGNTPPKDVNVPDQPLSVTFNQPVASAQTYRPSSDGTSTASSWQHPSRISVPVGPDVTLLKVTPSSGAGTTPTPAPTTQAPAPAPSPSTSHAPSPAPSSSGNGGGGQSTPAPTRSASPSPSSGLPALPLPPLGDINQIPVKVKEAVQVIAPKLTSPKQLVTLEVDRKPLPGNVLDPATVSPGTHEVRAVARTPDGQQVVSAQLVSVERPLGGGAQRPNTLIALVAAFLIAQLAIWNRLRRVRRARSH